MCRCVCHSHAVSAVPATVAARSPEPWRSTPQGPQQQQQPHGSAAAEADEADADHSSWWRKPAPKAVPVGQRAY